ncbi:MAG: isoleucine--tRNA ligase [Clostridiales bacterium]|jgi:isoleucyl-tRNA synthetase|nr:isoleucine--tRNA ligase [Clostridiales bacterium]
MYKKVSTDLNFVNRELETLKFWKENKIFEKSVELRRGRPAFTFFDGPPTANGKPHIGHVITRAVKDIIPRYKTMKGFRVDRKAGWDTHGLPVELEVEKQLGISGKPQIENYGVEAFIKKCKESVFKYESEWREMSDRVGFWADMENPYVTYHTGYIESVWWALKTIWDKGLIYKGHKVVPYCPRCGTALSSHEVAQGYKDVRESSVYVKFRAKDADEFFLAWTTTPWTLPSNVGLIVNADESYARVKANGETYIMALALLDAVLGEGYEITDTFAGKTLENREYLPLFDFTADAADRRAFFICCDSYVTLTDGTGIVHSAPAFGEDDARVGALYDLPFVQLVDEQGRFKEAAAPYKGVFVKDADPRVINDLRSSGALFREAVYEHSYPFCWRCDTPLLYYARDAWFIKMTAVREKLTASNAAVTWYPENVKEGRFGNFLENVVDWGISRERYWGTPLPIWECPCGHRHMVGSLAELKEMGENVPGGVEPHKPYVDEITLKCPQCGGKMKRVPEVIDCWFDSGAMPFAQWHYPFENKEIFEEHFPADFISEAIDQTRGWFYTLMAISTLLFERSPFNNCIVLGHVQDKDGRKMSKHIGNVVDPWSVLNKQGADAVRWYFFVSSAPWLPNRFSSDAVSESQRKFMGTFWNTYAFYILYAEIDGFSPESYKALYAGKRAAGALPVMDRWALSRLHALIKYVDEALDGYKITEAARAIDGFADDLSNWYIRRCRERFWAAGMEEDKVFAYMTLYTVLETVTRLIAPFTPFMAEEIYGNLVRSVNPEAPESVHFLDYPECDEALIDEALAENMDFVLKTVTLGRSARNNAGIKNRQPLSLMYIKPGRKIELDGEYTEIIRQELNLKAVEFRDSVDEYVACRFKPQLKTLGPKYGKILPAINAALRDGDGAAFMKSLKTFGYLKLEIEGTEVLLQQSDLIIENATAEGYAAETGWDTTVVISATLTPELIEEGFVREIISKLQTMRKEAGFEVSDKITAFYAGSDKITGVFGRNEAEISREVLAESIAPYTGEAPGAYVKKWSVNGEEATLAVRRC